MFQYRYIILLCLEVKIPSGYYSKLFHQDLYGLSTIMTFQVIGPKASCAADYSSSLIYDDKKCIIEEQELNVDTLC
jgi:hypothetical protein